MGGSQILQDTADHSQEEREEEGEREKNYKIPKQARVSSA